MRQAYRAAFSAFSSASRSTRHFGCGSAGLVGQALPPAKLQFKVTWVEIAAHDFVTQECGASKHSPTRTLHRPPSWESFLAVRYLGSHSGRGHKVFSLEFA